VKSSEFCENSELEVVEIPVAVCHAYGCSQGIVGPFDKLRL